MKVKKLQTYETLKYLKWLTRIKELMISKRKNNKIQRTRMPCLTTSNRKKLKTHI